MVTDTGVGLMGCNSFPGGVTMISETVVCLVIIKSKAMTRRLREAKLKTKE